MADNKHYITQVQENGNVMISEDVVTTIVAHAAQIVLCHGTDQFPLLRNDIVLFQFRHIVIPFSNGFVLYPFYPRLMNQ